jgi:hypothetical protein
VETHGRYQPQMKQRNHQKKQIRMESEGVLILKGNHNEFVSGADAELSDLN